uniref:Uncharacterized protein n=1 Tax=viral metagenome TaxID=1070528 RepID=A0A6C0H6I0_9ZZZZ
MFGYYGNVNVNKKQLKHSEFDINEDNSDLINYLDKKEKEKEKEKRKEYYKKFGHKIPIELNDIKYINNDESIIYLLIFCHGSIKSYKNENNEIIPRKFYNFEFNFVNIINFINNGLSYLPRSGYRRQSIINSIKNLVNNTVDKNIFGKRLSIMLSQIKEIKELLKDCDSMFLNKQNPFVFFESLDNNQSQNCFIGNSNTISFFEDFYYTSNIHVLYEKGGNLKENELLLGYFRPTINSWELFDLIEEKGYKNLVIIDFSCKCQMYYDYDEHQYKRKIHKENDEYLQQMRYITGI